MLFLEGKSECVWSVRGRERVHEEWNHLPEASNPGVFELL